MTQKPTDRKSLWSTFRQNFSSASAGVRQFEKGGQCSAFSAAIFGRPAALMEAVSRTYHDMKASRSTEDLRQSNMRPPRP
jgi:hypothetical protein